MTEWRAVFGYPSGSVEYGPWRNKESQARRDEPWRPDESRGRMIGLQRREVGPPEDVAL